MVQTNLLGPQTKNGAKCSMVQIGSFIDHTVLTQGPAPKGSQDRPHGTSPTGPATVRTSPSEDQTPCACAYEPPSWNLHDLIFIP